jgi:hypothetical protein
MFIFLELEWDKVTHQLLFFGIDVSGDLIADLF